jgi:DNA-binding SARP family transcriptional activator
VVRSDRPSTSAEMEFRLLGPLEVAEQGRLLSLGGVKPRSLLALLLLHANRVVSTERLIDELWPDAPPSSAAKCITVYVSGLRKQLGQGRLITRAPGYLMQVDRSELDLACFEQLLRDARGADPAGAAQILDQALALWRGPALADLAYEPFAQTPVARLEELRLVALEQRIDADLACARHMELVGELEVLVMEHPLRERLRCQLMLALYRSGRQAEALDAYQQARRTLSEELGLEPGVELKRLETAILQQDPALDVHVEERPGSLASPPPAPERSLLVVPRAVDGLEGLLRLAEPLAASQPPRELIVAAVVQAPKLAETTAALAERRDELLARGVTARTAAFSSPAPGEDVVRLASQQDVDLLLMEAGGSPLEGAAAVILEQASCDVALLVAGSGSLRPGPVLVPFGAARHDWAALELGAWVARATGAPLRIIGAASDRRENGRDASRLLADASFIVQRTAGVVAEPLLASVGGEGIMALAQDAGLLVVALSERWRQEGLGRVRAEIASAPPTATVFVRRGARPGGLAPPETRTRFSWSLEGSAS